MSLFFRLEIETWWSSGKELILVRKVELELQRKAFPNYLVVS